MTLQQLEYIVAVADENSFVNAAAKCFVTQPTLSMQIQKLEEELGVQIFDRNKKPVQVSSEGSIIVSKARQILEDAHTLSDYAKKEHLSMEGEFKLGVIPTLAPYILPLFIDDFYTNYPNTTLQIEELYTSEIVKRLNDKTLDIGLLVTPLGLKGLREKAIFNEPFYIYASNKHPYFKVDRVDYNDLTNDGLWLLQQGHCFRNQVLNICGRNSELRSNIKYESGSIEALKNIIKKNYGYTLVPELSIIDNMDEHIKKFIEPIPVREISLVVRSTFAKESLLEALSNSILNNLPSNMTKVENDLKVSIEN